MYHVQLQFVVFCVWAGLGVLCTALCTGWTECTSVWRGEGEEVQEEEEVQVQPHKAALSDPGGMRTDDRGMREDDKGIRRCKIAKVSNPAFLQGRRAS